MEFKNMLEKYMCGDINAESLYNYASNLFNELIRKYDFRKLSYLKMVLVSKWGGKVIEPLNQLP